MTKTVRKVRPLRRDEGKDAVTQLSRAGFYITTIARLTNLTPSQVSYRRKVFKLVIPRAYRLRQGEQARKIIDRCQGLINEIKAIAKMARK